MIDVKKIAIISGSKKRLSVSAPANKYFTGVLFRKAFEFAKKNFDVVLILSAKHYLLRPEQIVKPNDGYLFDISRDELNNWTDMTFKKLMKYISSDTEVYFYVAKRNREGLFNRLEEIGISCFAPLSNLSLGEQMRWFNNQGARVFCQV